MEFVNVTSLGFVSTDKNVKEDTLVKYAKTFHCRFETDCSYLHHQKITNMEETPIIEKVKQLKNVVHVLTRKVLGMEKELTEMKNSNTNKLVKEHSDQINKEKGNWCY